MTKALNQNTCYVFSENTLEKAVQDWLALNKAKSPEQEKALMITAAALPWFLKHLQQSNPIYMFTYDDLTRKLASWKASQLTAFPKREERIVESCQLLMDFFQSEVMVDHKMIVQV